MPKVLISDKMDPKAAQIFRDRGVEVDEITGLDKEGLIKIIGQYDGLAIRSATKVTKDVLEAATNLKVVGRAGIGVDNVDIPAASAKGRSPATCRKPTARPRRASGKRTASWASR
jgi:D-3-phosphoglycerate dehydrogenase / 2-oxoglutarate reductase